MTKTSSRSATHQGHCQVCGRPQMLPKGLLSKHGYDVRWGFFNGVCWGADHLPFELSKDLIEEAIRRAESDAASMAEFAKTLRADREPATAWVHEYMGSSRLGGNYLWREIPRADLSFDGYRTLTFPASPNSTATFNKKNGRSDTSVDVPYDEQDRGSLTAAMIYANRRRATEIDRGIEELRKYVSWQKGRIAKWAPHPEKLVPVEPKKDAPVHFARDNGMKSCVAGWSQTGYTGIITKDVAKVTCARCKSYRWYSTR